MSEKKWREFWVSKGKHFGSKLRAFNSLFLAESYYTKTGRKFDAIQVIEKAAIEEKEAQIKELAGALKKYAELTPEIEDQRCCSYCDGDLARKTLKEVEAMEKERGG